MIKNEKQFWEIDT